MIYDLKDAVAAVELLSVEDQRILRSLLSEAIYKKTPVHKIKRGEKFESLISAGLIVLVDEPIGVVLDPKLEKVRKKLCTYLSRRNEVEHYFDEELVEHEIPKGSQFVATIAIGAGSSLSLEFPDDEITSLLDQYGVNRCRGWKP